MYVSVIIPTYNREKSIKRSIESVLDQTYDKLELIVVDDGSTDGTEEIVKGIEDERLRYIRLDKNSGVAGARNAGVTYAKHELIAFHDSDDCWRKDKLEKQIKKLKEMPEAVMVYCAYEYHSEEGDVRVPDPRYDKRILEGEIYRYLLQNNSVGAPAILMKKTVFEKIGGFDPEYPALEDWELVLKAAATGPIAYVDEVLVDAYKTGGGVSSSLKNYYQARCRMIADHLDDIQKLGLFDTIVGVLFQHAESRELMDFVKSTLILALAEKKGI